MEPANTALITDPMALFGFLAALVALIFWVSELPRFKKFFEYVPPVIFVYFVPMLTTTAGITPADSPLYGWNSAYLLLFAIFLLMVSVDLRRASCGSARSRSSWWRQGPWESSSGGRFRS